jgi:hypothetical protein
MNDAPDTIVVLDPSRAAVDLADERLLNLSNPNGYRIVEACKRPGILLPEGVSRRLLGAALPLAAGDRSFPNDYVAAAALRALATPAGVSDPASFGVDRVNKRGFGALSREQESFTVRSCSTPRCVTLD